MGSLALSRKTISAQDIDFLPATICGQLEVRAAPPEKRDCLIFVRAINHDSICGRPRASLRTTATAEATIRWPATVISAEATTPRLALDIDSAGVRDQRRTDRRKFTAFQLGSPRKMN
jgi:hypothetical protein